VGELCGEGDEHSWHFWTCSKLKEALEKANEILARIDPTKLPMPIRHGIAPALKAKGTTTYWGRKNRNLEKRICPSS